MDGMLSQEEINALLSGMDNSSPSSSSGGSTSQTLTPTEEDAVGEISNISMGTAATTLSSLLNQRVNITTPKVTYSTWNDLIGDYNDPCVFIQIYYTAGLDGNNILILKERDVKVIADLMMGGDGSGQLDGELSELHLSAIGEAMNQMMGSASTSLSSMLDKKIDISPPNASLVKLTSSINPAEISDFLAGEFVKVSFKMEIGDLIDSELMQMYSFDFAKNLYEQFAAYTLGGSTNTSASEPAPAPAASEPAPAAPVFPQVDLASQPVQQAPQMDMSQAGYPPMGMPMQGMPQQGYPMPGYPQQNMGMYAQPQPGMAQGYAMPPVQNVNIAPVQFQSFAPVNNPLLKTENIDLLLDVPLEVTAELGRTSKSIKEILDFAPGTIIELNRLAGEPIDVLVNGKYVARGEVVVIEEAFGIRVTEVIK